MPSTWQELLVAEERYLASREEELAREEEELSKKHKLKPDEQRIQDERRRVLEGRRTELEAELQKHRAQGLQEIARRISKDRVRGIFDKDILVNENERVVLLVDGAIQKVLGPGVYSVGGLMRDVKTGAILSKVKLGHAESVDVIFVNLSDIDIKWGFPPDLWTSDGFKVGAHGIIRLKISEPDVAKLFANMMDMTASRIRVEDLRSRIGLEFLGSVIAPVMKSYRIDDLWGNKAVIEDCYNGVETEMRKTLSRWGFELIQFTINYAFPELWLKRKEETVNRPIEVASYIDSKYKYPAEIARAGIIADQDLKLLQGQYAHEREILDKKYTAETQQYDISIDQKRHEYELAKDRNELEQGMAYKAQLDKLNLDRDTAKVQLDQTRDTGRVQLEESQKDAEHKRDVEMVRTESEGRAQRLQILQQSGSSDAIVRGLEAETLIRIAELGGTSEAADAIKAKYNLATHEDAESKAFKQASDLVNVAKVPPSQPIIIPPSGPVAYPPTPPAPTLPTQSPKPASQSSPSVSSETLGKSCPNCNTMNLPVAKYCTSCGQKL